MIAYKLTVVVTDDCDPTPMTKKDIVSIVERGNYVAGVVVKVADFQKVGQKEGKRKSSPSERG